MDQLIAERQLLIAELREGLGSGYSFREGDEYERWDLERLSRIQERLDTLDAQIRALEAQQLHVAQEVLDLRGRRQNVRYLVRWQADGQEWIDREQVDNLDELIAARHVRRRRAEQRAQRAGSSDGRKLPAGTFRHLMRTNSCKICLKMPEAARSEK